MSRTAQRGGATPSNMKRLAEDGDICPVCKSSRYLNPNMQFLVNEKCYHKMCESCKDRIFSAGPANCPIAGCTATLRKKNFRKQTFEDIQVEREVDIRKRVAEVFNKREDDFETLRDYNDYLETVEEMTWNLISGIDVDETERRLKAFSEQNKQEIAQRNAASKQEAQARRAREADEAERAKLRRADNRREDGREIQENETARRSAIDRLGSSEDGQRVVLKKSNAQRKVQRDDPFAPGAENNDASFTFKGLKKRTIPEPEKAYDAFHGWSMDPQYFVIQNSYDVDWLNQSSNDMKHIGGGQDIKDFYTRALCDAFSGFGVFVEDEKAERDIQGDISAATVGAAVAVSGDVNMDDVF